MIGEAVRSQLHEIGVFLSNDRAARHKQLFNPFFSIEPESLEPTDEELELLRVLTEEYRTSRFQPTEIREKFWGEIANTIRLWKRADGWRYRRLTWTSPAWAPQTGCSLEDLFAAVFR